MTETPKIFISYSWTTPTHEDWVINLAERLVSDGVDVVLDKWDLKEGHDMYNFMETMVKSAEIQKVLIILDKKYSEKAEQRTGGVGVETQIISPKIYGDVSQEKFIPIVTERDENGSAYVPTFLQSRIYIDLSEQDNFEENYDKLLRNIFQRPIYSKPKLGKAPSHLFEETPMTYKTSSIVRTFDNQIVKSPQKINSIIKEFLEHFWGDLKALSLNPRNTEDMVIFGKAIHENILLYTPLRNEYIVFLDKLLKSELIFDIELLIKFLEKLPSLKRPQDDRGSWSSIDFDNFKFIIHEIFLYTITVGLKNEKYNFVEELLYSNYLPFNNYNTKRESNRFDEFYNYINTFDQYYKDVYSRNFLSPMADLMITRIPENISKGDLIDTDLLLHYIASLEQLKWFPITYIYETDRDVELLSRLPSLRHFEKVKGLFAVNTPKELQDKLIKFKANDSNLNEIKYANSFARVQRVYEVIDITKIGTLR